MSSSSIRRSRVYHNGPRGVMSKGISRIRREIDDKAPEDEPRDFLTTDTLRYSKTGTFAYGVLVGFACSTTAELQLVIHDTVRGASVALGRRKQTTGNRSAVSAVGLRQTPAQSNFTSTLTGSIHAAVSIGHIYPPIIFVNCSQQASSAASEE